MDVFFSRMTDKNTSSSYPNRLQNTRWISQQGVCTCRIPP